MLLLTLEGEDYQVSTACDGQEALDQVLHDRPDAILLDLNLPLVDGWQVIDTLDRDTRSLHIPIIAMSAAHQWFPVGEKDVRAYLSKPFDLDTLLITLDQVLKYELTSLDT
jgi:CheY-like chemotaxis protein